MKIYLDCEFNGFGGKLMSMALVPEYINQPEFYCELEMTDQLDPWVRKNVVMSQIAVPRSEFQKQLASYLLMIGSITSDDFDDIIIVADWPDDICYFCEALITGPGERISMPKNIKFELDLNIEYTSEVPHHAFWDARAIRDVCNGKI